MIKPSFGEFSIGRFKFHPRLSGCVAYYGLVESGGLTLFNWMRPYIYISTLTGTTTDPLWTNGQYGSELIFDGTNDIVKLSNSTDLDFPNQKFTISLIYKATAGNPGYIIARRYGAGGATGGYFIRANTTGTLTARVVDGSNNPAVSYSTVGTQYLDGKYHTLSVVFTTDTVGTNNDITIYADGVIDEVLDAGTGTQYSPLADYLALGATSDSTGFLTGSIQEVRIYNRELTYGEVLSYYVDPYLEFKFRPVRERNLSSTPVSSIYSHRLLQGVGL